MFSGYPDISGIPAAFLVVQIMRMQQSYFLIIISITHKWYHSVLLHFVSVCCLLHGRVSSSLSSHRRKCLVLAAWSHFMRIILAEVTRVFRKGVYSCLVAFLISCLIIIFKSQSFISCVYKVHIRIWSRVFINELFEFIFLFVLIHE